MTEVMEEKDHYLAEFARFEKQHANRGPGWLDSLRHSAIDRFAELGFPTLDDEEWRFTPLTALTSVAFETESGRDSIDLHHSGNLPSGAIFCRLSEAVARHPQLVQPHLGRYAEFDEQPFTALNSAFWEEGAFLYLPQNCVVEGPLEVVFRADKAPTERVHHRRCLVVAEPNSQARLIERYVGAPDCVAFTNAVTEVVLRENAIVDHYKEQRESDQAFHIATMQVHQTRSSNFSSHSIALGGRIVRNNVNAHLGGEGCECTLNGLYMAGGNQLIDNHTQIDHAKPHCASHELYKGVLDGKAKGVFNGKIYVHPDAQKTDAKQTNKTLLLSEDATINTKPQLEIYADDVKCTHGATVGQLDAEALFYLRSRGLGKDQARALLTFAFANDILDRIKVESLRDELERVLAKSARVPSGERGT